MGQCISGKRTENPFPAPYPIIETNGLAKTSFPETRQIFVAQFPYYSTGDGDLTIKRGDLVAFIQDYSRDWVCVEHLRTRRIGLVPKSYVAPRESIENELWYAGKVSRAQAENLLKHEALPVGTFLVRERETDLGQLALTVKHKDESTGQVQIRHYKIFLSSSSQKCVFLSREVRFESISELIDFYCKHITDHLCCQLTLPCPKEPPREYDLSPATQETGVSRRDLQIIEKLGQGNFAEVWLAKWKGQKNVAVKMLRNNGEMTKDSFLAEAKLMKECRHDNLVSLFGVCADGDPIYIVTEYMINGNFLTYLHKGGGKSAQLNVLIDMCAQTAKGMAYLESKHIVHRDLAARNVLVGENIGAIPRVRVADFGLAKVFAENYAVYVITSHDRIPIKWTAPEALLKNIYTVKSDVWSFGILLYEVMTRGGVPYPGHNNSEVIEMLKRGYRMPKPDSCPNEMYEIMKRCWAENADSRDTFEFLAAFLDDYFVASGPTYMEA